MPKVLIGNFKGPQGEQGEQGEAGKDSVGKGNTLPAGSAATGQTNGTQ